MDTVKVYKGQTKSLILRKQTKDKSKIIKHTITIKTVKKKILCFMYSVQYSMKLTFLCQLLGHAVPSCRAKKLVNKTGQSIRTGQSSAGNTDRTSQGPQDALNTQDRLKGWGGLIMTGTCWFWALVWVGYNQPDKWGDTVFLPLLWVFQPGFPSTLILCFVACRISSQAFPYSVINCSKELPFCTFFSH